MGTNEIMELRARKILAGIVFFVMIVLGARAILFPPPPIPIHYADGVYTDGQCGSIALSGGEMASNGTTVRYSLEHDKGGVYALVESRFNISGAGPGCRLTAVPGMKIRFEPGGRPATMDVMVPRTGSYRFTRVSDR